VGEESGARLRAAVGSLVFLVVAPGVMGVLIPWLFPGWVVEGAPWWLARATGVALVVVGGLVLLEAFARFARDGVGTPAPIVPTRHLVVRGTYRHVRNPMYIAVTAIIVGQALILGRFGLLGYAVVFLLVTMSFARGYEEPTLREQFGEDYDRYRAAVPGWWPRLTPYRAAGETGSATSPDHGDG
jgi:protein-S-isoprenylcysteine O-methyltransferase Ste14